MVSAQHQKWINSGSNWFLADPLVYLRDELRRAGYTVYDLGNKAHLDHQPPEDHTPYSATGWPGQAEYGVVHAIDIMPNKGMADLEALARKLIADKRAGHAPFIKYINWTTADGKCYQTKWKPNEVTTTSTDKGHIHLSIRTDYWNSGIKYSPLSGGGSGGMNMLCKYGDKGPVVAALQALLLGLGHSPGNVDSDYGDKTAAALKAALYPDTSNDGKNYGPWEYAAIMVRKVGPIGGTGQGPKGDKGDPGPQGEQGPKGDKGDAAVLPEGATLVIQAQ